MIIHYGISFIDHSVIITIIMSTCVIVEIVRFKISREVWKFSQSRKIIAFIEGHYKHNRVQSNDAKLYEGSKFEIPYSENLKKISIHFFFIDGLLTIDVGSCVYDLAHDKLFVNDGNVTSVALDLFADGSTVPIGKVTINTTVQDTYEEEELTNSNHPPHHRNNKESIANDHHYQLIIPGFRFKRLSRVLHWDRLQSVNLDRYVSSYRSIQVSYSLAYVCSFPYNRIVESNDSATLLTLLDDIITGDISQEEVDPKLYSAIQLAQYASQYLLGCRKMMKEREHVLTSALDTFQEEDDVLELKLTKLR